jgi:hypothetical protein
MGKKKTAQPETSAAKQSEMSTAKQSEMSAAKQLADHGSKRLAGLAVRLWLGDRKALDDLRRLGVQVVDELDNTVILEGPAGVRGGIALESGDPIGNAVVLGFCMAGVLWPKVFTTLMEETNKLWKAVNLCEAATNLEEDEE